MTTDPFWTTTRYVSDGGLETDLIFNRGVDLAHFASFPLVDDPDGRGHLRRYYEEYAAVAALAGAGLTLESPTWRASRDWGARLGYSPPEIERVNEEAVHLLQQVAADLRGRHDLADVRVIGAIGPRGDGYVAEEVGDADRAAEYHEPQVRALARGGADVVAAYTLTTAEEGLGVARAAAAVGVPVLVGFTVETDGRLPDGSTVAEAVAGIDEQTSPAGYVLNCAHPTHILPALDGGGWRSRVVQVNPNASTLSHAELDEAEELDDGDLGLLASSFSTLRAGLPALSIIGGCCGTDARHLAALWGV